MTDMRELHTAAMVTDCISKLRDGLEMVSTDLTASLLAVAVIRAAHTYAYA